MTELTKTAMETLLEQYGVDRETVVEILLNQSRYFPTEDMSTYRLAKDFLTTDNDVIKEYTWDVLSDAEFLQIIVMHMQPVSERGWTRHFYTRSKNPCIIDVNDDDCFYVESEFEGQYGKQFWVNVNNSSFDLDALPCRKALTQKLEGGKFYKCIRHDYNEERKYRYHNYEFEEISEEEYLKSISKVMSRDIHNRMYRRYD